MDQAPLADMAWSSCTSLRSLLFGFLVGTGSSMEGLDAQRASFILGLLLLTLARAADLTHPVSFEDFALNSYGSFE